MLVPIRPNNRDYTVMKKYASNPIPHSEGFQGNCSTGRGDASRHNLFNASGEISWQGKNSEESRQ